MSKYIAVDCGKLDTKVNSFDVDSKQIKEFKFRTKASAGTFDDDMLEKGTFITRVDGGDVYKIGLGAKVEAALETNKKSDIHRICTLAALAIAAGPDCKEDINVVIGIPYQTCQVVEQRLAYKDYILAPEDHIVEIKTSSNSPANTVHIKFNKRLVYPESIGVLYQYPGKLQGITGIIDIGNLNINNTYCDAFSINDNNSFTDELGGQIMINGLAQQLTSEMGARVSDDLVTKTLLKSGNERCLVPQNKNKEVMERSKKIIDDYLLEHIRNIKRKCDAKHWPLEFMNIVAIGGTTTFLKNEIAEVFGENVFIPEKPEYVNVEGFLKKMLADDGIDISKVKE